MGRKVLVLGEIRDGVLRNVSNDRRSNGLSVNDIAKMTGVPRSTIYAKAKGSQ